jgi:hypothetical protein
MNSTLLINSGITILVYSVFLFVFFLIKKALNKDSGQQRLLVLIVSISFFCGISLLVFALSQV